ncbi:unnamed protein product [Lactuca virosa]|uniref:F-box domain-containing protein n=1 Tax=Lactuca virosa TaxID=75947 RepID=A0AAU9LLX6_9ASTR|nr:unnamed protein product [Lactuca virosa]
MPLIEPLIFFPEVRNYLSQIEVPMAYEDTIRIPPEIISNILYRLPAKSLGRFRCVSKDWLSLISEPQFIKTHQNTRNRSQLIFVSNHRPLYSLPFHHDEAEAVLEPTKILLESYHTDFNLHGSCNGLVLVSANTFASVHVLVVLNPTTKEFVELPASDYEMINASSEIEIMYGFGYDSLTDDYKVVTISYFHYNYLIPPDDMAVHVYSLRTNTWRRVSDSPYDHSYGRNLPGVFVNGFLHWVAMKDSDHVPVILAFSLADERFSELPSPSLHEDVDIMYRNDFKLVVLGGKLAVFMEDEVWLMNEYGVRESWTKILVHGIHEIPMVEPMIFYDNGNFLLVSRDLMVIYDIKERSFCKSGNVSWNMKDLKVRGSYVESLVSPKFI